VTDPGWDDGREPDDGEEETLDVTLHFEDLGPGDKPGWPDDYVGPEIQTVLQTLEKGCRAGKSYRPDPSGRRRAVKAADYKAGTKFFATNQIIEGLEDLYWLLVELASDPTAFLVRGVLAQWAGTRRRLKRTGEHGYETVRRLVSIHGYAGAFEGVPRQLLMIDLDGIPLPAGFNVVTDPEACVTWAVDVLLPPEFCGVSFVYQLSPSAGLSKADDELSVHLWFFTERPFWDEDFRDWAHWWNAKQQSKIIDPALYNPVQPHYVNDPELLDGLVDPLAGRRLRLVEGFRETVALYMPTPEEIAGEGRLRGKRAATAARTAYKKKTADADAEPSRSDPAGPDSAGESDEEFGRGQVGAVRDRPGYRGYLRMIGFEGHIRTQIRAAIGSYFNERGSRADRRVLKEAIRKAIDDSPFLDCGEPWSRGRQEALDYLEGRGDSSNVDEMIADIARYQAARERSAHQECEPSWPMPSLTADGAYDQLKEATLLVLQSALALRLRRLRDAASPIASILSLFDGTSDPLQQAALCEPGVGKTQAVINSALTFLLFDPGARVVIAVPTHKLGEGLATRINKEYGEDIALEWNGTDRPDPQAPGEKMCRRSDAAADLIAAGGKLQLLCSSITSHCPHHPKVAGSRSCGYQRQQLQARQNVRVWIVPATMLTSAPPAALQRSNRAFLGDFDLLVIDEAPWFAFLGGHDAEPEGAPTAWLDPNWWGEQETQANAENKHAVLDTLTRLHGIVAGRGLGEIPEQVLREAGVNADDVARARRILWRWKRDLRPLVRPGATRSAPVRALADAARINRRVLAIGNVLNKVARRLRGDLAPSGLELIEHPKSGDRFLRLRWRKDVHRAWLKAPVLYLDAAGTGALELARAWLPRIELAVDVRSTAPYMRLTQITDSQMGYAKVLPRESSTEKTTGDRNAEKLARVVEVLGRDGLAVCPKELRDFWEEEKRLPGPCGISVRSAAVTRREMYVGWL
jgi:hypothetical protein